MKDAFGAPQSLALLGGTSEIGLAICTELAKGERLQRVVLAGRDPGALKASASSPALSKVRDVDVVEFDATDFGRHDEVVARLFAAGDLDVIVLAFGVLGSAVDPFEEPEDAIRTAEVNYVGTVSVALRLTAQLRTQGHGTVVFLSSVAGERGRASNFVYGSSKAGLDTFAQGMGDRLQGTGIRVLVVRPGFVHSRMTAGMAPAPFACDPEDVAVAVAEALRTGAETVWVPPVLRLVMATVRHLPRPVFRRLKA